MINIIVTKSNLPKEIDFKAGALLLIDKPKGWTSFDVVNKVRYKIRHKLGLKKFKVGHAGTLDPMATGLLLVCIGKYTKLIEGLQGMEKSYDAIVKLGATTPSYDAEEEEDGQFPTAHINMDLILEKKSDFEGPILQKPPIFSALKVDGVRLYKKARKGIEVEIKSRPVVVHQFGVNKYEEPYLDFTCSVSKGTYIRSIAHDFGQALGSGGYLTGLIRTSVGNYQLSNALDIEGIIEWIDNTNVISEE